MIDTLVLIKAAARKAVKEEVEGTLRFFKGDQGPKGDRGESIRGEKGDKGDSIRGEKGDPGRGLAAVSVNKAGELLVRFDDGETVNAGIIRGKDGKDGKEGRDGKPGQSIRGADGRGVASAHIDDAGDLIVTFSDGQIVNAGQARGPIGERGQRGPRGPSGSGGGGASLTSGTAVLSFGAAPGSSTAETVITGQSNITGASNVRVWLQGDATADFNAYEHSRIFPARMGLAVTDITAGVGFTIIAATELRLAGNVACRWEWS